MHGDLLAERCQPIGIGFRFQAHQHADFADIRPCRVVNIGGDDAWRGSNRRHPAEGHIFADRGDERR